MSVFRRRMRLRLAPGSATLPSLGIGEGGNGLYQPAAGTLALAAGGSEMLRASAGSITLGAAPNAHSLAVMTPASAVNRVHVNGAVTAGSVSVAAAGSDANIPIAIASKGTGAVRMQTRGQTAFEVNATGTPGNYLRADAAASGGAPRFTAQGSDTNIHMQFSPKGSAYVETTAPFRLPTYTVATLPSAATFARCMIYVSDGAANKRLAISDGTSWRWPDGAVVA